MRLLHFIMLTRLPGSLNDNMGETREAYAVLLYAIMEGPVPNRDASIIFRLANELGMKEELVRIQQLIQFAEDTGQTEKLYQAIGTKDASEFLTRISTLSSRELARIALPLGMGFDEMMKPLPLVRAFLSMFDTTEAFLQLDGAIKKVAANYRVQVAGHGYPVVELVDQIRTGILGRDK